MEIVVSVVVLEVDSDVVEDELVGSGNEVDETAEFSGSKSRK